MGHSINDVRKNFGFFDPLPLVRKFTQPPSLRLLTMSAFEGSPSPLSADVINGSPLIGMLICEEGRLRELEFLALKHESRILGHSDNPVQS